MGWMKLIKGEKVPDKNDPGYAERYEKARDAGAGFAHKSGLCWMAEKLQRFGERNKKTFLVLVFGFVITLFLINVVRLLMAMTSSTPKQLTAVERMESALKEKQAEGKTLKFRHHE